MSGVPAGSFNGTQAGKKAVHVKWAGKTIALGTFPSTEADEKCARAKALTRAWRSTMRPKPTRDWVMNELERLGVRVVSGRLGRKAEDDEPSEKRSSAPPPAPVAPQAQVAMNNAWSSSAELDHIIQQRRSSSLGLSMMSDRDINRRGSIGSLGPVLGFDSNDFLMPPHRPLVGGGSAAAYEAARADHYAQKREEQQRRASSLGLGMSSSNMQMGLSVNPNQHYEMLKLHHMNLLNEIQETTLMMNLYQQQQLRQQQQQLQQRQASVEGSLREYGLSEAISKRASLGLGADPALASRAKSPAPAPPAQKKKSVENDENSKRAQTTSRDSLEEELLRSQKEQEELEKKLKKIKEDIARRAKEAEQLQKQEEASSASNVTNKRNSDEVAKEKEDEKEEKGSESEPMSKKAKNDSEEPPAGDENDSDEKDSDKAESEES